MAEPTHWQTVPLSMSQHVLAPDGSEIRLLAVGERASMVHCRLPAGKTSRAVVHKTVEELWFVLAGHGLMWRQSGCVEGVDILAPGCSLSIPTGTVFQFQNTGPCPLDILIVTTPPWPGDDEAEPRPGLWIPS